MGFKIGIDMFNSEIFSKEFAGTSLSQWCSCYLKNKESLEVCVEVRDGKIIWSGRAAVASAELGEFLEKSMLLAGRRQYLCVSLNVDNPKYIQEVARQISSQDVSDVIVMIGGGFDKSSLFSVRGEFERFLFGFYVWKHPAYYEVSGPVFSSGIVGCYQKRLLSDDFDSILLGIDSELHMDMLRIEGVDSDSHVMRYHFAAKYIKQNLGPRRKVLDLCCGAGYGAAVIECIAHTDVVVGVDSDEQIVGYARSVFGRVGDLDFEAVGLLDYLNSIPSCSFDAVVMFEGMQHVKEIDEVLREVNRVLTTEGVFISSVPNKQIDESSSEEYIDNVSDFDWDIYRSVLSRSVAIESMYVQSKSKADVNEALTSYSPKFNVCDPSESDLPASEWLVSVCKKRSVFNGHVSAVSGHVSFELQEYIALLDDPAIKVVSFDIFDTLLCRPVLVPEDVFYFMQQRLVDLYGEHYSSFAHMRFYAEKCAREMALKKGVGDITIFEIYSHLADFLALDDFAKGEIMQLELDIERNFLAARPGVKMLYDRAVELGKKVVVVSDMYLPSDFLLSVLIGQGYGDIYKLWVSGENKVQKRTGLLFDKVIEELYSENICPENVIHFGDNYHSDIEMAMSRGFLAKITPKAVERYAGTKDAWPSGRPIKDFKRIGLALRSFVGCQVNSVFSDPLFALERGTVFGKSPYNFGKLRFSAFVYFSVKSFLDRCVLLNIERVLFLTRDGHVYKAVFNSMAARRGLDITVGDLEISRPVLDVLQCNSVSNIKRLVSLKVSQGKKFTLLSMFSELLGITEARLINILDENCNKMVVNSFVISADERNLLMLHEVLESSWTFLSVLIEKRINNVTSYVRSLNLDSQTAIWDVGYFHTVANILSGLGEVIGLSGHLIELSHHESRVARGLQKSHTHSFVGAINNKFDKHPFSTETDSMFLEMFLSDPSTASRILYTQGGSPIVVSEKSDIQKFNRSCLDEMHAGIIDACDEFDQFYSEYIGSVQVSPTEVFEYSFHQRVIKELINSNELVFENNGIFKIKNGDKGISIEKISQENGV